MPETKLGEITAERKIESNFFLEFIDKDIDISKMLSSKPLKVLHR